MSSWDICNTACNSAILASLTESDDTVPSRHNLSLTVLNIALVSPAETDNLSIIPFKQSTSVSLPEPNKFVMSAMGPPLNKSVKASTIFLSESSGPVPDATPAIVL